MRVSNDRKDLYYEHGSASGYVASDRVCLSTGDDVCANDMLFLEVDRTEELALAANGVLGLSPGSTTVMTSVGHEATNSFIERLYSDNLID